jgi:DNA-binding beta-propeller fold protein YncE
MAATAVLGAAACTGRSAISAPPKQPGGVKSPVPQQSIAALEFPKDAEWLNVDAPITMAQLKGKIVLLDFWTYCCINCMHIIPDLKKLEAKYPTELVVIGVHSAKFANEKESENIREAILRYEIEHPVINDKDFVLWKGYGVEAWPTVALIDPEGNIVGGKSGEGVFEPFDRAIAQLKQKFAGKINTKPFKLSLEKDKRPKSVLSFPSKIALDAAGGRMFFTDSNNNRVLIASLSGQVQTVIGQGAAGLADGTFSSAKFFRPQGVAYDAARNLLYVADTNNHAVRRIDLAAQKVTTLAGNGQQSKLYPPRGGTGREAFLASPWDLTLHNGKLYIAMAGTHQIWSLDPATGKCGPYAGSARENIVDGPLMTANLAQPSGIANDGRKLYFADSEVSAVRTADLTATGKVETLIGEGLFEFGDVDGAYPRARLQHPLGVALKDGKVYVADTYNHKIKVVDPKTKTLTTFLGTGRRGNTDGDAKTASFSEPAGLAWLGSRLYICDTNNHLLRIYDEQTKQVTTLKLTGLDKLTAARMSTAAAPDKTITLEQEQAAPGSSAVEVQIVLPSGTKFNTAAPFRMKVTSSRPDVVNIGTSDFTQPLSTLRVPITAKPGETTITIDILVNYCNTANEGLCYFKDVRLVLPVKVVEGGKAVVTALFKP